MRQLVRLSGDEGFKGKSRVEQGTELIIEAMKVMNQIRAPNAGRVTRVYIGDAEPVEYGSALMLIE
jgi:acetyl-CoA carboxylase biotin carboxyl carrier protein